MGRSLEEAGDAEAARERFEAALAGDPDHPQARAALLSLHESAQHVDNGVACLVRWAESSSDTGERAAQLVRAAAWEMRAGDREESAERNLRAAV